jgi:hypothetical protein
MANSVYPINKGINKSIEFKGLKAQYIWYLGGGVILLMMIFAAIYIIGLPLLFCLGIIGTAGTVLVIKIYRMSHRYGQYGMMKALAKKQVPKAVKNYNRNVFLQEDKLSK